MSSTTRKKRASAGSPESRDIAHVDHGKDAARWLLRQTGALPPAREAEGHGQRGSRADAGITIHAKNTAIDYEGVHIHIVDTPVTRFRRRGGAVLAWSTRYCCSPARSGRDAQTRFVLRKALEHGLKPILVVNKIDRVEQRAPEVVDEVFDLLVDLGATDDHSTSR